MSSQLEKLIKVAYKKWKADHLKELSIHPDEEAWAGFLEGRVSQKENEQIKEHLLICDSCAEAFTIQVKLKPASLKKVPQDLLERMRNLVMAQDKLSILEILLVLKEKAWEILHTTGDVLVGQEFIPAPVLRSRQIKDFKDEVTILKDFKDIRVEVKLENKGGQAFDLTVLVKDKQTHCVIKDLRVTLLKDDLELESYLTDSKKVIFEHVLAGRYTVEISNIETKIASIVLDIKR
jgi:hypothetical protein